MTDIPRLIEKLEAATEGSITLDVEVLNACGFGSSDEYPTRDGPAWLLPTRSLEDALQLAATVLPSHDIEIAISRQTKACRVMILCEGRDGLDTLYRGYHRSCSVAVCIALAPAAAQLPQKRESA